MEQCATCLPRRYWQVSNFLVLEPVQEQGSLFCTLYVQHAACTPQARSKSTSAHMFYCEGRSSEAHDGRLYMMILMPRFAVQESKCSTVKLRWAGPCCGLSALVWRDMQIYSKGLVSAQRSPVYAPSSPVTPPCRAWVDPSSWWHLWHSASWLFCIQRSTWGVNTCRTYTSATADNLTNI